MLYYYSLLDMDLSFSPSLLPGLLLCTSVTLIFLFCFFKLRKRKSSIPNLPPGKVGWPIMGETLQFLLLGRKGHPERFICERKKKYSSDIFRTSLFGDNMVFFCGPAANKFLFSNENKLVAAWLPNSFNRLFFSDTSISIVEKMKPYRDLLLGFLKLDVMKNYIPIMDRVAKKHIEKEWEQKAGGEVVVHEVVKKYLLQLACQLLMGIDYHEHLVGCPVRLAGVMAGIMSVPVDFPGTIFNKAIKDATFLRKETLAIITERKTMLEKEENPTVRDLLSYFLLTPDANGKFMSEEDISYKILGLLIAGETASTALTFTVKYLAEHPHFYQEVYKEVMEIVESKGIGELLNWDDVNKMRYTWNVVCEAMRLAPPAQIGFKEALTDFTIAGFTIPKGWKACWSAHSTHKDPDYFPNPEIFDPTRFEGKGAVPYTYVPFGGGPRICPGKDYARLEILVFIYNLVKKFRWNKLIPNEMIVFRPNPCPENGLPIRLQPHESTSI
ncbi:hypothetical protein RHMOL_Rhmol11G0072700 [Rhododendron molle]|uniref:Uncharacterized protein n=1 Tax=Rhododendron molle TaxID=49168 RepID=A0ACC0LPQ6_RHOML|nr:hypothetical protein RHMOL_Rhmol11G0072700 [Rhododendron molle]